MIFHAKGKILLRNPGKKTILQLNETSKYLLSLILRNRKHYGYASLSKLSYFMAGKTYRYLVGTMTGCFVCSRRP